MIKQWKNILLSLCKYKIKKNNQTKRKEQKMIIESRIAMVFPFIAICVSYFRDNARYRSIMDKIESKVGPFKLFERQLYEVKQAKKEFIKIHDRYKKWYVISCIVVGIAVILFPSYINIFTKSLIVSLYILLCIAFSMYSYARTDAKYIWYGLGIICFTASFIL